MVLVVGLPVVAASPFDGDASGQSPGGPACKGASCGARAALPSLRGLKPRHGTASKGEGDTQAASGDEVDAQDAGKGEVDVQAPGGDEVDAQAAGKGEGDARG